VQIKGCGGKGGPILLFGGWGVGGVEGVNFTYVPRLAIN
jgi:hypothetical protein